MKIDIIGKEYVYHGRSTTAMEIQVHLHGAPKGKWVTAVKLPGAEVESVGDPRDGRVRWRVTADVPVGSVQRALFAFNGSVQKPGKPFPCVEAESGARAA